MPPKRRPDGGYGDRGGDMRFDAVLGEPFATVPEQAATAERLGYAGVHATELTHDPFLTCTLATTGTRTADVGTQIAVAFARNPMSVAVAARDLQDLSGGRFVLGLGTQVEAHITRRFSMPWGPPAERIAEFVRAVRAIWQAWEGDGRLRFQGEHYRHTLMTPAFSPGPAPNGLPPVHLAAVGARMAETAGAVADGVIAHVFCTPRYLEEVVAPAAARGLTREGRDRDGFAVVAPAFVVTGRDDAERAAAAAAVRAQIAFYGSTPAYRGVLEIDGRGNLADRLHELSVSRDPARWAAMAALVDDEVLASFAVVAERAADVPGLLRQRYDGLADRVVLGVPSGVDRGGWLEAIGSVA
ncbi:TIGR03617 family F420-dependent LLM class oxidoreductase [Amnibacterium sp. CER49]|uniref:TIGR03617 family F420-dependent LLM class oxidoreductase n=1 Tax=Amnibacterium sp. CER49 TaxID=3039161 RepID=UPI00244AA5D8|nr:TIGR03617 family F420-dependent LLM class oxidoreductase [Amnibacterium sp. CER49]MDH2443817.1 TIGR03617 family F420-dependent LLM class oxidoreductase [Amnibacterium sp. CER49]